MPLKPSYNVEERVSSLTKRLLQPQVQLAQQQLQLINPGTFVRYPTGFSKDLDQNKFSVLVD
jgi:hypothetical protein